MEAGARGTDSVCTVASVAYQQSPPEERELLCAHKEPRHKQINPGMTPASSLPSPSFPNKSL